MAQGFVINALMNARSFLRGTSDMEGALEDVEGALEDVNAESKDMGRISEQAFKKSEDAAEDAAKETSELEKRLRKVRDTVDDVGDKSKKAFKKAGEGAEDFKQEANSSAREAAASFDGSADSITDIFQEISANAFAGFGPAAAAAGLLVGAALGTVLSNLTTTQEKLSEAREKAAELSSLMYENNGSIPLKDRIDDLFETLSSEIRPNGPLQGFIDQWADFGTRVDALRTVAEKTNRPVKDLVESLTGSDMELTKRTLEDVNAELKKMQGDVSTGWVWETAPLQDYVTSLETLIEQERVAQEVYSSVEATQARATQAHTEKVAGLSEAWQNAAVDAGDYFTETEEGALSFDWGTYLEDAEATVQASAEYKSKLVGLPSDISTEAQRIYAEQGPIQANAYLDSFLGANAKNKARFLEAAKVNGTSYGKTEGEALGKAVDSSARATAQGLGPIPVQASVSTGTMEQQWAEALQRMRIQAQNLQVQGNGYTGMRRE